MSELEEFGVEEFGSEPEPAAAEEDAAALTELVDDLTRQLAATMDEVSRARLKKAKEAAVAKLAQLQAPPPKLTHTEGQWLQLQQAWDIVFGLGSFSKRIKAEGGVTDDLFRQLTSELSAHHAANKKKRGGAKPKGATPPSPDLTPNERFQNIVVHAKNCKLDAQAIFDELGLVEVNDATMDTLVAEINQRAGGVEEFGAGKPAIDTQKSASETVASDTVAKESSTDSATANPSAKSAADLIDFSWYDGKCDEATGEVYDRDWLLNVLGWTDFPTELTKEHADRIVDVLHTRYLDPAARYRSNADKLAAPLEKKAEAITKAVGAYLDALGEKSLPKHKNDSKPGAKVPHKAGDFISKTLQLPSGAISWVKDGGVTVTDSSQYFVWLNEKKAELLALREKNTPEALEEMATLEKKYGIKLKTEVAYDKDLIAKLPAKELPPGWADLPVNHFARRTIK